MMPVSHLCPKSWRSLWQSRSPWLLLSLKSTLAAGFSWQIALVLLGAEAAALAVVSAVIVVQVTSWQTVRKSLERLLGVLVGVSLAVLVGHFLGLSIWTITLLIFSAQFVALFLQRHGQYLATQIPISAALALVLGAIAGNYPLLRLLGVLIGGLVGTLLSILLSPPIYVWRARKALAELASQQADALAQLAEALAGHQSQSQTRALATRIRNVEQQVRATEQAYALGMDSARLNPWAHQARRLLLDAPEVLQALDRVVRQMRRIAYTINEAQPSWSEMVKQQEGISDYAGLLEEIGLILASVGKYLGSSATSSDLPSREVLRTRLLHAQQQLQRFQSQLAQDARDLPTEHAVGLPLNVGSGIALRGTLLTDLRRMLEEVHEVFEMALADPSGS